MCKKSYINAQQLVHIYRIFNVRVGTAIYLNVQAFQLLPHILAVEEQSFMLLDGENWLFLL